MILAIFIFPIRFINLIELQSNLDSIHMTNSIYYINQ